MPRHLNLRDDFHISFLREADDPADLLLRIESRPPSLFAGLCPDLREARVFLNLDAPALVIREVPVEFIDLVVRCRIDERHDVRFRQEMAAAVEHEPAVFKAGPVLDVHAWNRIWILKF